jgi:hypothetical protein
MRYHLSLFFACLAGIFLVTGCSTYTPEEQAARAAMIESISHEQPGDYYIGRRFYKVDFKMWGWLRKPGQQWKDAQLVMFNEQTKLAPDREQGKIGADSNYEYRIMGHFSGEKVYEPASNTFYPEFILTGYELRSVSPPPIFKEKQEADPAARILLPPV